MAPPPPAASPARASGTTACCARWPFHTLGHPALDTAGVALYTADFLEPGRAVRAEWRASLRRRMPGELDEVALEVADARTRHLRGISESVRPETAAFLELLRVRAHG